MSVIIKDLVKQYNGNTVVDHISFGAERGEIVGFLGPNGAGKSTTMKIASCFLSATSGNVRVDGYDVTTHSLEVRKRLGYLPENNPLYGDMYVTEYLGFIASLYGLTGSFSRNRVNEIMEMTGLVPEKHKRIHQLSKGYRQRVGLAQTIIHDPDVLIMDEPTTGLDPNQILEIRDLIKHLSKEKTVILSTHILQEVRALCDRLVIIHKGKIVADDRVEKFLTRNEPEYSVMVEFAGNFNPDVFGVIQAIRNIEKTGEYKIRISVQSGEDIRPEILRIATESGLPVIGLTREENSLESFFRELTKNQS